MTFPIGIPTFLFSLLSLGLSSLLSFLRLSGVSTTRNGVAFRTSSATRTSCKDAGVAGQFLRRGAREIYDTPLNITRKVNISRRCKFKENVITGATKRRRILNRS